jgi:hypothetical protein
MVTSPKSGDEMNTRMKVTTTVLKLHHQRFDTQRKTIMDYIGRGALGFRLALVPERLSGDLSARAKCQHLCRHPPSRSLRSAFSTVVELISFMSPRIMSSPEVKTLQKKFTITPKTATLLVKAGYADYRALASVSPEYVAKQFQEQLGVPAKLAAPYKRAMRRIVWLGTQERPETYPKNCKDWSNRALASRGIWCSDFDRLTGDEIDAKLKEVAARKPEKTEKQ